ncbi:MAG: ATP-binding protein, partial [Thermodesulfobacteriota bacterium]
VIPHCRTCWVMADANQVEQILMNLMINAQEAMGAGGRLTIEAARLDLDAQSGQRPSDIEPGPYGVLKVSDTGCGMDAQTRDRIFEPFFSTKGELDYGLGLATVHGIVKQHGGTIQVASAPEQGTVFTIFLPAARQAPTENETPAVPAATAVNGAGTILIVEDNEMVRNMAHSALEQEGYTVCSAASGNAAMAMIDDQSVLPDLLLTDVVLPQINGKSLYEQISSRISGIRVLYMSGYSHDVIAHHGILDNDIDFLQKPFSIHQLGSRVREVFGKESH